MHQPSLFQLVSCLAICTTKVLSFVVPEFLDDQTPFSVSSSEDVFAPPPADDDSLSSYRIPTRYESTVQARRLLSLSTAGVMSTVFPPNNSHVWGRPASVSNTPFGMIEYISDCEAFGDPTVVAINIATTFRNAAPEAEGENRILNVSLSLDWWTQYRDLRRSQGSSSIDAQWDDLGIYSPASLPRLTLQGYLEPISKHSLRRGHIPDCFLEDHPDAKWWAPENPDGAHGGRWMRMRVQEAYWFGGFGDRAFIGWLDPKEYRGVDRKEIMEARLPGEEV